MREQAAGTTNSCSKVYFDGNVDEQHRARRVAILMRDKIVKRTECSEAVGKNVSNDDDSEKRFDEILSHSGIRYA